MSTREEPGHFPEGVQNGVPIFSVVLNREGQYNDRQFRGWSAKRSSEVGGETIVMIKAFNKHYRKAVDLLENASSSEKIEIGDQVLDWFHQLPEEYLISLALFFNEVIDDLGDESLEKIDLGAKQKKEDYDEEEEADEEEEEEDEDEYEDDTGSAPEPIPDEQDPPAKE